MKGTRLDQAIVQRNLAATRSQAENYIKLGYVQLNGRTVTKSGQVVSFGDKITLSLKQQYVSRAALKLESVSAKLNLDFRGKVVLDVGSSTGGFTDFALKHGAKKVIAVDVGSKQMHPSLRNDSRVELHESTDIRKFNNKSLEKLVDLVLIDVSFISLKEILPVVAKLVGETSIVAMCKPQFEASQQEVSKGVVKNDALRRKILREFELWVKHQFLLEAKADSSITGAMGNLERFYLLKSKVYA